MIKAVKFASVPVTNQDRALEFYTEKLGLRVITDSPFDNRQRWIELGSRARRPSSCCLRRRGKRS